MINSLKLNMCKESKMFFFQKNWIIKLDHIATFIDSKCNGYVNYCDGCLSNCFDGSFLIHIFKMFFTGFKAFIFKQYWFLFDLLKPQILVVIVIPFFKSEVIYYAIKWKYYLFPYIQNQWYILIQKILKTQHLLYTERRN